MTSASDICAGRLAPGAYHEAFSDLHAALDTHEARVAAERCLFCYDAPCVKACPTSIDIPLFIRQIATGNPQGAGKTILDSNILGGMCARVCPTETLCEEACVRDAAEGKPVRSAACSATPPMPSWPRDGSSIGRARAPASASRWSAPGPPGSPAPTGSRCSAMTWWCSRRGRSPAASTSTASPPTRRRTTSPRPRSTGSSASAASSCAAGRCSAATSRWPSFAGISTRCSSGSGFRRCNALGAEGDRPGWRRGRRGLHRGTAPGEGSRDPAGRPPRRRDRRRHDGDRRGSAGQAARRRGSDHRLSPRRRADGREPLRAGAGADQRRR